MASSASLPSRTWQFLTFRRGGKRWHWTDLFTYGYLGLGIFLMFGPVVWLVLSSFKTPAGLLEFPPTWAPLGQVVVEVEDYKKPLPMYRVTMEDGTTKDLAQIRRIGMACNYSNYQLVPCNFEAEFQGQSVSYSKWNG